MTFDLAISGILILLVYMGTLYCLWKFINAFHDGTLLFETLEHASKTKTIFIGAMVVSSFIGWVLFFQAGFERALFFLPWNVGEYDSGGEFESYRWSASWVLAIFSCMYLHHLAGRIIWRNNQRYQHVDWLLKNGHRDLANWWLKH